MGSPPPPDLPAPDVQDALAAVPTGLAVGLPAASLCGYALPNPLIVFGIKLPSPIPIPPPLPIPKLALGLNCSLDNPLDLSASVEFGGGRVGASDPDPDLGPF